MEKKATNNERNAGRKPKPYKTKILRLVIPASEYDDWKRSLQEKVKKYDSEFVK